MTPGFWPSTFWCTDYWHEDFWQDYSLVVSSGLRDEAWMF